MDYKISNPSNQTSFQCEADETILQSALRNGHLYPYGCQSGACGACKSKLISGTVKHRTRDAEVLSDDERAEGWCLTCQAVPLEDIDIEVKEIAKVKEIEVKTLPTRVRQKNLLADDVIQLYLSLPNTQLFDFLPGQYIKILLKNGKERSFSIANTPEQAKQKGLELHVRVVPGGHYSPQIKNQLKVKDIVRIQGPYGTYFLRKDEARPIIMVAGGTGFAPIKGLIEDVLESGIEQTITLYWGARTERDLYMNTLAQQWAKEIPGFSYIPVLSEDDGSCNWQGETGFVHKTITRQHADINTCSVYASGPPVMIKALEQALPEIGLDQDFFYTDAFDYAAQNE